MLVKSLIVASTLATASSTAGIAAFAWRTQDPARDTASARIDRTLHVSGEAAIRVVPDLAKVTALVDVTAPTADKALAAAQDSIAQVLAAARRQGVEAADLQALQPSVGGVQSYDKRGRPLPVVEYRASGQIVICVRDLAKLTAVTGATKAKHVRVDSITYDSTRVEALRHEARLMAVRAAREKAEAIAGALKTELGAARTVTDGGGGYSGPYTWKNMNASFTEESEGFVDGSFAAGQMSITASSSVVFDLRG